MKDGYYTLIFDQKEQMNVVKDTTVNHVVVEKIFLEKNREILQSYVVVHKNGNIVKL